MSFPYQYVENYGTPTTPHASPWESDNSTEMFIQEQPIRQPQAYEPPQTIQLEEQPPPEPDRIVPSQRPHELRSVPARFYPMHEARLEGDGGEHKPQSPLVDPSLSGNGSSSSSSMPIRHAPTRPHLQLATHPYRRPQSASSGSGVRRERQHVRFASTGGGQVAEGAMHMPPSYPPGPSSAQTVRCASHASILGFRLVVTTAFSFSLVRR